MNNKKLAVVLFLVFLALVILALGVIAVAGGVFYASTNTSCAKSSAGFTGNPIFLKNFGVTTDNLQLILQNTASERITVTRVEVTGETGTIYSKEVQETLNPGGTARIEISGIRRSEDCNTYDVELTYDRGEIVDQQLQGTITGEMSRQ